MVDIVTRAGKGSPLTNNEVDANFTNLAEVAGVTGEPMGHEDRTTSTISFNASTRTFTIAPVSSSFTVWCKGKKVVVSSAQTVTIPNTTGMYSIYFDANGTLAAKAGYFTFSVEAPTAYVYWNATTGAAPYFGDERHGVVLDWQTHEYLHRTRGAAIANGFLASGYTLNDSSTNAATQIAIESGTFFDEDMKIDIVSTATPTAGTYQQNLLFPAKIPVMHLQGTSWVMDAPTDFPFKQGTSRPQYNSLSGGVWSTADVGNNQHATTWILATNNLTYPVIGIIGQSATDNLGEAEAFSFADLTLTGFPSVEFRPLYKLIYKASDGYANSVNAQLVSIVDLRSISAVGSAANPATDHGNLSGLTDDDHPQYLSVDTVRGTLTAAVKASFLPSQAGNAGKFLTTDATSTSWAALTSGNITTALGFTPYNATNPAGYITGITSGNVTTALGFTPYNATNPSGFVTAAGARGAISVTGAGSYDSATGVINIVGGVTSFNTRTGAITLSSADVTTALGFTPYNSTNPNGYLTGITSTQVTTALGYTPYNSSNPSGYITGITSGMVTTALGFTPYNNSNPSGYITSSALSGYLTSASAASTYASLSGSYANPSWITSLDASKLTGTLDNARVNGGTYSINISGTAATATSAPNYLPLSGGNLSGPLTTNNILVPTGSEIAYGYNGTGNGIGVYFNNGVDGLYFYNRTGGANSVFIGRSGGLNVVTGALQQGGSQVLTAANYNSYAPTLTGTGATGTWGINITGNAATATTAANYLPLSGGSLTGALIIGTGATAPSDATSTALSSFRFQTHGNLHINGDTDGTTTEYVFITSGYGTAGSVAGNGVAIGYSTFTWKNNVILHAGNYNSYAPTLTGGGASGTWGINVTGYSAQVNLGNSTSTQILSNVWAGGAGYPGYQFTGGNSRFGFSSTGGVLDVYADGNFYATDSSYLVLHTNNYNSYAPTLTGTGATGTWNINITGTSSGSLALTGGTMTGNILFGNSGLTKRGIQGTMADNDFWFIGGGGTGSNSGFMEIATGDDGQTSGAAEPIYVSQYGPGDPLTGTLVRRGSLLDANGNTSFPGTISASSFAGSLATGSGASGTWGINITGNAATATTAANYVPLSGGTLTGNLTMSGPGASTAVIFGDSTKLINVEGYWMMFKGHQNEGFRWQTTDGGTYTTRMQLTSSALTMNGNTVLHAGNFSSYAMPTGGGTFSGNVKITPTGEGWAEGLSFLMPNTSTWGGLRWQRQRSNYDGNWYVGYTGLDGSDDLVFGANNGGSQIDNILRLTKAGVVTTRGNTILHSGNYTSYAVQLINDNSGSFDLNTSGQHAWVRFSQGAWGNNPYAGNYSHVLSFNAASDNRTFQIYGGDVPGAMFVRRSQGGGGTWHPWEKVLTSYNYDQYAVNRGGDSFTGNFYFISNRNTDSSGNCLQAHSTNGSGATMSFHRSGYYAVNFGLDSDNVMRIGGWSASTNRWQLDMGGNMTVAGNVTAYSDERLKKDWAALPSDFVERLAKIKSGTYTRIDSKERQAGVSAQDFQKLLPETVSTDNEGMLSVNYGGAALASAVELAKEVVDLRKRVAHLESLINKLIED
jgi:hypothetical protein